MKGRKPKPVEQKKREGNPGNRPLPEPVDLGRLIVSPDPPADLPEPAAELWRELVPTLTAAGVLHRVDYASLVALCLQWDRAVFARRALERDGLFAEGSMGQTVEHPAVAMERNAHAMFLRLAEQFGITPAARARIAAHLANAVDEEDELADVLDLTPELR